MSLIAFLILCISALFPLMQVGAAPSESYKINDPLILELWNASSALMHIHNPRCGIAEPIYVTVEFNPDNQNYISPGCRVLGHLMPNFVDFVLGCPKLPITDHGDKRIKFYYTNDNGQILDWNIKAEQVLRGDLKVVDTSVNKPDVVHVPVHVSLPSGTLFQCRSVSTTLTLTLFRLVYTWTRKSKLSTISGSTAVKAVELHMSLRPASLVAMPSLRVLRLLKKPDMW
jgi:hypothetical protein